MKKLVFLFAMVLAASFAMAQNNTSTTDVTGSDNVVTVDQTGHDNSSDVTQDGKRNNADVNQGDFGGGSVQSNFGDAMIEQIGNDNQATVNQRMGWSGSSAVNTHSVSQDGKRNIGMLTTFNGGNRGMIVQQGNDNWAKGRQSNGPDNMIDIAQVGNDNWADVNQLNSDENSKATVSQTGHDNWTSVDQSGGKNHEFIENTTGNWNTVTAVQLTSWAKLDLTIEGNSNTVNSSQDHNDKAYADIIGNDNLLNLDQAYNANHAGISVDGNGNSIDIDQTGAHNHVTTAGTNAFAKDGVIIMGNANTVDIDQMTDMNQSDVSIMGMNNQTIVVQQ